MKKLLFVIMCCIVSLPCYCEQFNVASVYTKPVHIKVYNKDNSNYLWHYIAEARTFESNGNTMIEVTEKCGGKWNNKEQLTWEADSYYTYNDNKVVPDHATLTFYDMKGNIADKLDKKYSLKDKKVYCLKNGDKKEYDFEEDLIDKEVLGTCLMNYPYDREKDFEFHFMTNEPAHYKMTMVNKGKDTLKINGKDIECYKLQMIPDLGMLGFVGAFVPKTYFWYKTAAPHEFVRYEGLESGLNTPYIYMEADQ
jgi:hypothetical protein